MKYVMLCINSKLDANDNPIVRRVLLEYEYFKEEDNIITFYKTRFVEKDPYFYDKDRSLAYSFKDANYKLVKNRKEDPFLSLRHEYLLKMVRKYHSFNDQMLGALGLLYTKPILIEADSDAAAIKAFKERDEQNDDRK